MPSRRRLLEESKAVASGAASAIWRMPVDFKSRRLLLIAVIVGLCFAASAMSLAQDVKSDLLRGEDFYRRGAWTEAEGIFSRMLAETPETSSAETERRRRVCVSRLIEIHRRLGHYQEALTFALDERATLRRTPALDGEDWLQRNALVIAECHAALKEYSEARATLQDVLDRKSVV